MNDLHTASLTAELAALLGGPALINEAHDRNDVDLTRVSDANQRGPWFLERLADLVDAAVRRHGRATLLALHGWNVVQPVVDLGLGCTPSENPFAVGRAAAVSPAFAARALPRLVEACRARGITATVGARYPARHRENLVQLFTPRYAEDGRPLVRALAALAPLVDAVQLELGIALRGPGPWRARPVAACTDALPALLAASHPAGALPGDTTAAAPAPPIPRRLEFAGAALSGLVGLDAGRTGRLLLFPEGGGLFLFTGERLGHTPGGLCVEPTASGGLALRYDGPLLRFPDTTPFLDLETGLARAELVEGEIELRFAPGHAHEGPAEFGTVTGSVALERSRAGARRVRGLLPGGRARCRAGGLARGRRVVGSPCGPASVVHWCAIGRGPPGSAPRRAVAPPLLVRTRRTFPKMALRHRLSPRLSFPLALLGAALLVPAGERAWATSKAKVAAIGDAGAGGGVFAGPGFVGWPTAGGNGWIAFRGQVSGGTSSETIVAAHLTPPVSRAQVASIGQTAPSGNGYEACAGKLKQFVGHPVVNASGEVVFVALLTPPPDKSKSSGTARGPTPAGIFALRSAQLAAVACSGEEVGGRTLDLTAVLDLASNPSSDLADRSPAMNDAGDVAFLAGYVDTLGFPNGGAILLAPRAGGMTRLVRIDDPFASGRLQALGPPALNNRGMLAFHALSTTTDPSDHGMLDGVFALDATGANLRVLVRDGIAPSPAGQPLTEFQDAVALDDDGDVAFLAGPLSDDANPSDEGSPGVLVLRGGVVSLLAYPGQVLGSGGVTGGALGPAAGGALAAPSIGPDGTVAFFASLEGNAEVIARTAGRGVQPLVSTGGNGADASPVGGLYGGAESPPALDAAGGIVVLARIVNGQSSEAIVYRAADGRTSPIALGEAAPQQSQGFFAGRPFSAPHMNDAGDIVFRAYVARGPASIGIFRARSALIDPAHGMPIETVVRAGDASPAPGSPPFFDFPGEPSVNRAGAVAFAARLPGAGRGLFVADARGVRPIVLRGDPAPGDSGTTFTGLGTHPQLNDSGGVAFRGTTSFRDPSTGSSIKRDGIFLADSSRIRALVYAHEPSPAGPPFLSLGDPVLSNAPGVVFRAPLGDVEEESSGIFTAGPTGTAALAVALQPLGGGVVLSSFSGSPSVTPSGDVAFLATLSKPIGPATPALASLGPAILTETPAGPVRVAARGTAGPAGGLFNNLGPPALNSQA